MSLDRALHLPGAPRAPRGPAGRISPSAAVALWVSAGVAWFIATRPDRALGSGSLTSDAPFALEQWAVLVSTFLGVLVLLAGLFAVAAYAVYWPEMETRVHRHQIAVLRGDLAEVRVTLARVAKKVAALQQLRTDMADLEAQLLRDHPDAARQAGRVMGSGRDVVDDILSELGAAYVPGRER
jgi:hypothetical protein